MSKPEFDNINPDYYNKRWSNGAKVIDIAENLTFCCGNAVKYVARAGLKNAETEIEDLEKAIWYLEREIARLKQEK